MIKKQFSPQLVLQVTNCRWKWSFTSGITGLTLMTPFWKVVVVLPVITGHTKITPSYSWESQWSEAKSPLRFVALFLFLQLSAIPVRHLGSSRSFTHCRARKLVASHLDLFLVLLCYLNFEPFISSVSSVWLVAYHFVSCTILWYKAHIYIYICMLCCAN